MSQHQTGRPEGGVDFGGDDFDALTELFLGDAPLGDADAESRQRPPAHDQTHGPGHTTPSGVLRIANNNDEEDEPSPDSAHVKALVRGHLPVFAAAWANQYARHLAREVGHPVAALRIRGGESSLHLVNFRGEAPARQATLREAIETARAITPYWVLRVGELDEPELAASDLIEEITLLTGVDEAALVASYRTLKRIVPEDAASPDVTIAVMGADEQRAHPIAAKISEASRKFLERDIRVVCCIEKITGGSAADLFTGEAELSVEEALELIESSTGAPARRRRAQSVQTSPQAGRATTLGGSQESTARPAAQVEARPAIRSTAAERVETSRGGRATVEQLDTLEARCPYAPEIRLGADQTGGLHVIAPSGLDVDAALRSLATARSWAVDHRDLIALTRPGSGIERGRDEPVAHLITRSPPEVRRVLDTNVRVHLEVEAAGTTVLVPLN